MADFPKRINRTIEKKDAYITRQENAFLEDDWGAIEDTIYRKVRAAALKFNTDGGKLVFDDSNVEQVARLNQVIIDAIQSTPYPSKVRDYLGSFDTIKKYGLDVVADVNQLDRDALEALVNPVQRATVQQTLDNLTGVGINSNFVEPLKQGIYKNIVAGSTITDLETYLKSVIQSDPERMGQLKRYSTQVARDALNQYDGQVNARIASEFELDAYQYVGSIIADSRPQCVRWAGSIIPIERLPDEIAWMYSNGTGSIPGTTVETFPIYRGGYNCRHSAIPIRLTRSQRAELGL